MSHLEHGFVVAVVAILEVSVQVEMLIKIWRFKNLCTSKQIYTQSLCFTPIYAFDLTHNVWEAYSNNNDIANSILTRICRSASQMKMKILAISSIMTFATLQEATFDAHDSNISPHPKNIETAKNSPFLETFLGVLDLKFAENNMRGSQLPLCWSN